MARLSIYLLGTPRFELDGNPIDLPRRKATALLAYLAATDDHHRREMLATFFWPDSDQKRAYAYLRNTLWEINRTLGGGWLLAERDSVRINPEANIFLDLQDFRMLLAQVVPHTHPTDDDCQECTNALEAAIHLYRGDFLAGFGLHDSPAFDEWQFFQAEENRRSLMDALGRLIRMQIATENFKQAIEYARRWVHLDPINEAAHRELMQIYAWAGQRNAALRQYQECQRILKTELKVEPDAATTALFEQIQTGQFEQKQSRTQTADDLSDNAPPESIRKLDQPDDKPRNNLPHPLTSFIGRREELEKITKFLTNYRLVTLTGTGGIGKTQLSIQTGRELVEAFPDGVWLVEFAPITDPNLIPQTAANALGLWESASLPIQEILLDFLQEKNCLLIFDNCEHLITAAAQFAETVLQRCPDVKILASSLTALDVHGEMPFLVPPFSFPADQLIPDLDTWDQYDALRLFADRAAAALPDFQITQDNLAPLVKICQRLDGIPLALELAAARVNILPLEQIATRLDDRFRLLTGGSRTAPTRQQTLRASIEWGWELLSDLEQELLPRLSVFAGGMHLEAVEAICAGDVFDSSEVLDILTQLVNKSMVVARRQQGQETRYRLLETIRQYAQVKLTAAGLRNRLRDRHLDYFVQLGDQAEEKLIGPDQVAWLKRLEQGLDNIRAALSWALETDPETGLRLCTALWRYWTNSFTREGEVWVAQFLAQAVTFEPTIEAKALWLQGLFNLVHLNNFERGQVLIEKSLALCHQLGDQQGIGRCLFWLSYSNRLMGSIDHSFSLVQESISIFRALGDKFYLAAALNNLGVLWVSEGSYEQGMAYLDESESLLRELGDLIGIAEILSDKGQVAVWQGDYDLARLLFEESQTYQKSIGFRDNAWLLINLGELSFRLGEYEQAREYFERSLSLIHQSGNEIENVWIFVRLGYVSLRVGDIDQAWEIFVKSLDQFKAVNIVAGVAFILEGLANLAVNQGQAQKAAQLIGWADAGRQEIGDTRPPIEQADVDKDIATIIEMIGEEAYAATYAKGQTMTMDEVITYAKGNEQTLFT